MKTFLVACALVALVQAPQVAREESRTGHVLYTAKSTATDDSGQSRRVEFVIRTKGDDFKLPDTDALIRLEVKQATRGDYFDARAEATCGEKSVFGDTRLHSYTELDAETLSVFTRLTLAEAEALAKCDAATVALAGIRVRLTTAQLAALPAALSAARGGRKAP